MGNKNLSFVLESPRKVKFEDRPVPELVDPYYVLVQVKWTGICGSDVHYWDHGKIGRFVLEKPMVLGHESAGVICKVGDAVQTLQVGDRVAMEPGVPCRRCTRCKEGQYNLCDDMVFAATPPYDGTLANYYALPADFCARLPDTVTLEEGALVEPASVAVHVCRQADIRCGDRVVVFGAGPVGLLCCAVARSFGASSIVVVDINEERLDFATKYAATQAFLPPKAPAPENAERLVKECGLGNGADIAIDASGAEACIQMAVHVLRSGGTYVQAGMGKDEIAWPIAAMVSKELTVKGSFRYSEGDYAMAVRLIADGKIDAKALISNKVKFEDAEQAFRDVKDAKGIKILIEGPEH